MTGELGLDQPDDGGSSARWLCMSAGPVILSLRDVDDD